MSNLTFVFKFEISFLSNQGFYILFYRGRITEMGSMNVISTTEDLHDLEAGCLLTYEWVPIKKINFDRFSAKLPPKLQLSSKIFASKHVRPKKMFFRNISWMGKQLHRTFVWTRNLGSGHISMLKKHTIIFWSQKFSFF